MGQFSVAHVAVWTGAQVTHVVKEVWVSITRHFGCTANIAIRNCMLIEKNQIITQCTHARTHTVYDRMDAAATINFSVQSGAATIRERRLFRSERVQKFKSIIIINIDIIIQVQG